MNRLLINSQIDTPLVNFNFNTGVLEISGKSLPEDVNKFYNPIEQWLIDYFKSPKDLTTLNLKFFYLNSSSSKKILEIIKICIDEKPIEKQLVINWYYKKDDDEQLEEGQCFSEMLFYPFNFIEF